MQPEELADLGGGELLTGHAIDFSQRERNSWSHDLRTGVQLFPMAELSRTHEFPGLAGQTITTARIEVDESGNETLHLDLKSGHTASFFASENQNAPRPGIIVFEAELEETLDPE